MAWGATVLAKRQRTSRRTYGLRRTTILAALGNGGLVLFAIGGGVWVSNLLWLLLVVALIVLLVGLFSGRRAV